MTTQYLKIRWILFLDEYYKFINWLHIFLLTGNEEEKLKLLSALGIIFFLGIYLFKVNNRNIRTMCEISSKSIIKTSERRQWCRSGVFIVNFEHISRTVLLFLLLTLNKNMTAGRVQQESIFGVTQLSFFDIKTQMRWYQRGNMADTFTYRLLCIPDDWMRLSHDKCRLILDKRENLQHN